MVEYGIRVSGLAARWHIGSDGMTQPWAIFQQAPGHLPTSPRLSSNKPQAIFQQAPDYLPTSPRLSSNKPVEVKGLDISTCSGL